MDNPFSPQHQRDTRGNPGTRPEAGAAWCRCPHSRAVFEQIFSHIPFVVAAVVLLLLTRVQPPTRRVFCNPAALPVVARRRGFDALGKLSGVIQLPLPVMHRRNSYSGSGHGRLRSTSPRTSRRNSTTLPVVRRRNLGDRGAAPP
ncbi:hypothetical protein PVAP13_5NG273000 [Panicum virgatum]|uniref:Uncharacterized protein n=1 Tax=Panicum virgatum TaxID=38727 RepID=A0A8T0S0J2_PANVG|nr:hypothetical protein PVAP13_5NG273000 [Panicum virgatum]